MLLIDPATGGQVVAPGICFICEHHLDENWRLVDTGHSLMLPDDNHALVTHLHGVKYICEHCAISAASCVMDTDLRDLANELVRLQAQVDEANAKLASYEGMDDRVVDQLQRIASQRTWTKPGPKPGELHGAAKRNRERKEAADRALAEAEANRS